VGRRAQKKQQTTLALQQAAYRLFRKNGYGNTTVDDIAAAAGVSTRTYYRYFRSKEDVVLGPLEDALEHYREILAEHSASEPPLQALQESFVRFTPEVEEAAMRERLERVAKSPELQRGAFELGTRWQRGIASDLADKAQLSQDARRRLSLTVGMAIALWIGSFRLWVEQEGKKGLADTVADTFGSIADVLKQTLGLG
jgi:AcrR family transcriptional regulator